MWMIQGNIQGSGVHTWCISRAKDEQDVCLRHCRHKYMPHISASTDIHRYPFCSFDMHVLYIHVGKYEWLSFCLVETASEHSTPSPSCTITHHPTLIPQIPPLNVKHRPHVPRAVHAHAILSAVQWCTSSCIADPSSDLFSCCWVRYVASGMLIWRPTITVDYKLPRYGRPTRGNRTGGLQVACRYFYTLLYFFLTGVI